MDINVNNYGRSRGTYFDREITQEQYERAKVNNGFITEYDKLAVLTDAERLGYGATASSVYEKDGKYYVCCHRWNHCD